MNNYRKVAKKLKVMGHPVRLQILDMLRQGEVCVCHIEEALDKRQAYISQQLMTLRDVNLVTSRRDGLQVYYRLIDDDVADLLEELFGLSNTNGVNVLESCSCPTCTVTLSDIG